MVASKDPLRFKRCFRYDTSATWFRGNTHIHSVESDGGKTFRELAKMYANAGYDFLYRTDHWVASDVRADKTEYPLLWLDGIELDGCDSCGSEYHVVCLGTFSDITGEMDFNDALERTRAQDGLLILAHPHWMGNSLDDVLRWEFHGVEVYNHVCRYLNGKGNGSVYWHALLEQRPDALGFAVDDAHIRPGHPTWNGGWIMVNASELTRAAIDRAVRAGNFYSSCGPEFQSIELDGDTVAIVCSPVRYARLVGPGYSGKRIGTPDGALITEARFEIPVEWSYMLLQLEDDTGRRAWTNTLFTSDGHL